MLIDSGFGVANFVICSRIRWLSNSCLAEWPGLITSDCVFQMAVEDHIFPDLTIMTSFLAVAVVTTLWWYSCCSKAVGECLWDMIMVAGVKSGLEQSHDAVTFVLLNGALAVHASAFMCGYPRRLVFYRDVRILVLHFPKDQN